MRCLLLPLLLATSAFAQTALYVDLSGQWHKIQGDQPAFSTPDFDDSHWSVVTLPRTQLPSLGFTWFRRRIQIPSWVDSRELALTLGTIAESYEVYINGRQIGKAGGFATGQTYVGRPATFRIPAGLNESGSSMEIALRTWRGDYGAPLPRSLSLKFFPDEGPYLLTDTANAPHDVSASQMWRRERLATISLLVSEFLAVLALILLVGWLSQRQRTELALLAGFLLTESWVHAYDYVSVANDWPHLTSYTAGPAFLASSLFLAYLGAATLGVRMRWLIIAAWIELAVLTADNILLMWTDGPSPKSLVPSFSVYSTSMAAVDLLIGGTLMFHMWRRYWRHGKPGPQFASSIAILAVLMSQRSTSPLRLLDLSITSAGYRWTLFEVATALVACWMTIHLIRELGAVRQRLAGEMEAARAVQQLLLPVAEENWQGYQVQAEYLPSQEVGGDFYQFMDCGDGSHVALIGDVSGKGLKAAMLVSVAVGALQRETSFSPAAILSGLNRSLLGHSGGAFVTCCCVRFESDGRLTAASAGHPAPYRGGNEIAMEAGLPLGITGHVDYPEVSCTLFSGEQVTLISDGIPEAAGVRGELLGFERTRALSKKSAAEISEAAKAWGQNDDITVVTIRRTA